MTICRTGNRQFESGLQKKMFLMNDKFGDHYFKSLCPMRAENFLTSLDPALHIY